MQCQHEMANNIIRLRGRWEKGENRVGEGGRERAVAYAGIETGGCWVIVYAQSAQNFRPHLFNYRPCLLFRRLQSTTNLSIDPVVNCQ